MIQWIAKIKNAKKDQLLILLLFGILLVVIAWPTGTGSLDDSAADVSTEAVTDVSEASAGGEDSDDVVRLEARLEEILSQVEGVGKVRAMITLQSDGKKVVEKDTEQSQSREESIQSEESSLSEQSSGSETTIYEKDSSGSETPFVVEELSPEILGVLVIAQGAGSAAIEAEITEAVMALFGIEAHKIKVMKME